ncbi:MAG TPA: hypothetical protein VE650_19450 [Acetobacteraceae bacterium]|jgi:hypothetical protein|nr:hypothetical protein [Acetobacteraceae bacterium]
MPPSLAEVTRGIARELLELEQDAAAVQDHLAGVHLSERGMVALQSLDRMTQALGCLGAFLADVADQLPPNLRPDLDGALAAIRLSRLANRLGASGQEACATAEGEFELF